MSILIRISLLASAACCANATTLFSFSQASQNWYGQNNQPHCTQSLVGGGLLTTTTCPAQVASGAFGPNQGGFTTTYSSASSSFAGAMALGGSSAVSNVGDYDREAAQVLASSVSSFDTMSTFNIPGVPANTLVLLDLSFTVTGFATSQTVGNILLNTQSELRLGLGGSPAYNDDFLQISAGVYKTQGVVFTGVPYHVVGYLSTQAQSGPTAIGGDPNNPFGFPFSASANLDFAHTVVLSGASASVGGTPVTNFVLLDENGNPITFGSAATPEPSTMGMASLACVACGLVRAASRRRLSSTQGS